METAPSSVQGFPRELLSEPTTRRLRYFETKVVAHQRLKEVHASLLHAIQHPAGASLLLVCGPTGVGKTTLRQRIERQFLEDATTDPSLLPGHIPVVAMEAASPDSSLVQTRRAFGTTSRYRPKNATGVVALGWANSRR